MSSNSIQADYLGLLSFDEKGWLYSRDEDAIKVIRVPTPNKWDGMHSIVKEKYGNKLLGTCTHYDALGSAKRTAEGFSVKGGRSASTHGVIDRISSIRSIYADIYVLASIHDRTWHAGLDFNHGDTPYTLPNGVVAQSPNQWFSGWDLSNWGDLRKDDKGNWCSWPAKDSSSKNYTYPVFTSEDDAIGKVTHIGGRSWESYTLEACNSYMALMAALVLEQDIKREWHVRHSDLAPKNKMDPGPHFPFAALLDRVYEDINAFRHPHDDHAGDPHII